MNTSTDGIAPYSDPHTEQEIQQLGIEVETSLRLLAQQEGLLNRPATESQWTVIRQTATSRVQEVLQDITARSGVKTLMALANQPDHSADKIRALVNEANEASVEYEVANKKLTTSQPYQSSKAKRGFILGVTFAIGGAEGVLSYSAVRHIGLSTFAAVVASCALGAIVVLGTHFAAKYAKLAKSAEVRNWILGLALLGFGAGFLGITKMRAFAIAQDSIPLWDGAPQPAPLNSSCLAIALFLFSFLLFGVGLLASYAVARSKGDAIGEQDYLDTKRRATAAKAQRERALTSITDIDTKTKEKQADRFSKIEYALTIEPRLRAMLKRRLNDFIKQNASYRTTEVPECMIAFLNQQAAPLLPSLIEHSNNY